MAALGLDLDCSINDRIERSASAPPSPNERSSASTLRDLGGHVGGRRVTFPDDDTLVTGYFEAPDPWSEESCTSPDNIVAAYRAACWKQGVKPLQKVLQQLQSVQVTADLDFELNLKGERLTGGDCEALEEIFKRLQFRELHLQECQLDDEGAAALFDMIEYYDTTSHLDISHNGSIGNLGWQACSKMLKRTPCLSVLDCSWTGQTEQSLLILGRALRTPTPHLLLRTLKMEGCGLTGRTLVILVAALKLNSTLQELFLGQNRICSADGLQLGNLLRANSTLQLLDLAENNLQDLGICHLVDGLCQQASGEGGLRSLGLRENGLTKAGMAHISRALLTCESVCDLDLSCNDVGDEGLQQLKQGLLSNHTLNSLCFRRTKITCEGAVALAECIADHRHIAHLDLRENTIGLAGLMALSLSLGHNRSLVKMDLDDVPPDQEDEEDAEQRRSLVSEIRELCQRNRGEEPEAEEEEDVPVVRSEAELASLIKEKTQQRPTQASPRNRFRVQRVFLDGDAGKGSRDGEEESPVFSMEEEDAEEGRATEEESGKRYIRHQDSIAVHMQKVKNSRPECRKISDSAEEDPEESADPENEGTRPKKLTFVLPEGYEDEEEGGAGWRKDRRMSTPALASQRAGQQRRRRRQLSLKLGRQLEGLDLRSSVPLSPTRLREGLLFPEPFDNKVQ